MGKSKDLSSDKIAAITALAKCGKSNKDIATITGIVLRSVQRWTKKFRDCGENELPAPGKRTGRPPSTSERTRKVIRREVDKYPRSSARQLKERYPDLLGSVAERTVRDILHRDLKFTKHAARKKPLVTLRQRHARVAFSKKYLKWGLEQWKGVLWSDEATFSVTGNRSGKVYRRPGSDPFHPKFIQSTVKHPDSLMVWGCFGYHGVGKLVVLPKNVTVNKDRYLELLSEHLYECFQRCQSEIFMQDGAPCHTAKLIKEWFDFVQVKFIKDWPGNSPDLNPIENLWGLIKGKLRGRDTSSLPKLEAAIVDVWNNINPQWLQHLALSLPNRLFSCKKAMGCPTRY